MSSFFPISRALQLKNLLILLAVILGFFLPSSAAAFITTTDFPLAAENLVPGASVSGVINVENPQSSALNLQVGAISGTANDLANNLNITIAGAGGVTYSATLGQFFNAGAISLGTVGGGSTQPVHFTFSLPSDAPSSLMGKNVSFDFCIGFAGRQVACGTAFAPDQPTDTDERTSRTGSRPRSFALPEPTPLILGAVTEAAPACQEYLRSFIRQNANNDPAEVIKLQEFLRDLGGFPNLAVTGVYDETTISAVRSFQANYRSSILAPWGIAEPTGFVFYTTRKAINEIYCRFTRLFPLTDAQLQEIARVRALGQAWTPETANVSVPPANQPVPGAGAETPLPPGAVAGAQTVANEENIEPDPTDETLTPPPETERPSFLRRVWNWIVDWF